MGRRFSPLVLLAVVSIAGLAYAVWYAAHRNEEEIRRALVCRLNQNLIDRFVATWEHQHSWLDAGGSEVFVELDAGGTVVRCSPALELQMALISDPAQRLAAGSRALALVAREPEVFECPEPAPAGAELAHLKGARYRWVLSSAPQRELGGRLRGTVCLVHGARPPSGNAEARHAR